MGDSNMSVALEDPAPLFVKFYATWCSHCKSMQEDWEVLSEIDTGDTRIADVECIQNPALAERYGITGYPTLLLFRDGGKSIYEHSGGRDTAAMSSFVLGDYKNWGMYDPVAKKAGRERRTSKRKWFQYIVGGMMLLSLCIALLVAWFDPPKKKKKGKKGGSAEPKTD